MVNTALKPPRNRKDWKDEETRELYEYTLEGYSIPEIAKLMGMEEHRVRNKARSQGYRSSEKSKKRKQM